MDKYSCREATRLVLEGQDRELTTAERTVLQFHWGICAACRKFRDQTEVMRQAMMRWRSYRDGDESDNP